MYAEFIPSCSNEVISKSSEKLKGQATGSSQFGSVEVGCLSRNLTSNQFFSEFLSDRSSEDESDETDSDGCNEVKQRAGVLSIKKVHFYSLFHNQVSIRYYKKHINYYAIHMLFMCYTM